MPVTHERDDARRLITVGVTEPYDRGDILQVIERQAADDTWAYALLYDLRATSHDPTQEDLQQFMHHVQAVGGDRQRGPVAAFVSPRSSIFQIGQAYVQMVKPFVEVELLFTEAQVADWLQRNTRDARSVTHGHR
jgi:hypothetical protein